MTSWPLRVPAYVSETIRTLHPDLKRKVRAGLDEVRRVPLAGKPLADELQGVCTHRVGHFRILYRVHASRSEVEIVAVGPRESIYLDAVRLLRKG